MRSILKMVILVMLIFVSIAWSIDKTSTGFYYPTGISDLTGDKEWLASGCNGSNNYFINEYHIGHDFFTGLDDPVYAIADGKVVTISYNGWGAGNVGIFIKHRLSNGDYFLALYGHITTNVSVGDKVFAGKVIGNIGPWDYGTHLHFGIVPGENIPPSPWGRMDCVDWPATNSFVDPIDWLINQTPYPNIGFYPDGWHTDGTSQVFVDAFNRYPSHPLGQPINNGGTAYVHEWYGVYLQDFFGDNTGFYHGYTSIMLNSSGTEAYVLKEGFWDVYMNLNQNDQVAPQILGTTTTDEYLVGSEDIRQDFANGYMFYDRSAGKISVYDNNGNLLYQESNDLSIALGNPPESDDKTAEIIAISGTPNPADLNETVQFQFDIKETSGVSTVTFPHIEILIDNGVFQNFYLQEIATDFSLGPGQTRTLTHSVSFSESDFPPDQYSVYLRWNDGQGNYFTMPAVDGTEYPYHESVGQAGMPEVTLLAVTDPAYAGQDWHTDFELTPQSGQTVVNDTIRVYYAELGDVNRVLWGEWFDVDIASGEIKHFTTMPEPAPGIGTYEIKVYSVINGIESLLPTQSGVSNPLTVYVQEQNPGNGKAETNCFYPTTNPIKDSPYEILIRVYETTNTSSVTLPEVRLTLYDTLGVVKCDLDTFYNIYLEPDGYFSHQEYYTFKDFGRQTIGLRYTYDGIAWDTLETFDSQFDITGPPNPYPIQVDTLVPAPPLPEGDWALLLRGEKNDCALITHDEQKGLDLTGNCSFEAWIKPFEYGGIIVSKFDDDIGARKLYNFSITNDGRLFFSYINDYAYKTELQTKDVVINLDKWQHVAACVDVGSASVHFYVNGQSVISQKLVGNSGGIKNDENVDFIVGAYQKSNSSPNTSNHFTGLIDKVRVWNKLRSDVEVEQGYNSDLSGSENGLVAYWKFDSTYVDFSQNENQLTPINGPIFVDTSFTKADYDTLMGYHLIRHDTITQTISIDICDGAVYSFSPGWSGARSGANLSDASHNETEKWGEFKDNFFHMYHIYLLAHTEDLPDSAELIRARLGFYPEQVDYYDNNKYCYLSLVQAAPYDIYRLTNGDWPNFRTYNYAEKLRLEDIIAGQVNYFNFVSYGLNKLSLTKPSSLGIRTGFDLENNAPRNSNYVLVAMVDNSDVEKRPFLEVTYVITTKLEDNNENSSSNNSETLSEKDGLRGVTESIGKIPVKYNLYQNYPNPFNPQTTIRYALPKDGNVRIVVYDILGRKVTELVNDYKSAGYYKVIWNTSNISSGVYIYQMTSGSFNSVKKMLLLR